MKQDGGPHPRPYDTQALLSAAFNSMRELVFIVDRDFNIVFANHKALSLCLPEGAGQARAGHLVGENIFTRLRGYGDLPLLAVVEQQLDRPEHSPYGDKINARFQAATQAIPVEVCPSRFEFQRQNWVMMVVCDTRYRNDIHRFYYDRENELRDILDNMPDAILRVDSEQRLLYANETALQCMPKSAAAIGLKINSLIGDSTLMEQIGWSLQLVLSKHIQLEAVLHGMRSDLRVSRIYQARFIPEFTQQQTLKSVLVIARPASRQYFAEQQVRQTHEQLRQMTQKLQSSVENERKHMAREIHDELGQHLTSLRVGISLLGQNHPALQHEVEPLTQLVDGTIKVVRDIATQLRPAVLNMGLKPALIWLRDQFNKHRSGVCTLTIQPLPVSLCDDEVTAIFRVVQESLTNVQRHAKAREVEVKVLTKGKVVLICINDDGQGFDPGQVSDGAFGLLSMRERCMMKGWTFNIHSTPGKGSCVHIEIPYALPAPAKVYDSE
ncbi:PAS domain-containing protein [Enterobacter sp. Ap-916]|uniref:histidine kinase n=1 Tax=unclassified Enterobacter TaxID=2608935 RepID=UPI00142452DC|nr:MULTISPECIES: histidine kinase [unclassified Enterobacter]NIF60428.1 PAS domain-containing protein [Enterobacter sp. Ap-867]NIG29990.1 PAS domain-containing protein [Enterobacter sp. Ap-916]